MVEIITIFEGLSLYPVTKRGSTSITMLFLIIFPNFKHLLIKNKILHISSLFLSANYDDDVHFIIYNYFMVEIIMIFKGLLLYPVSKWRIYLEEEIILNYFS